MTEERAPGLVVDMEFDYGNRASGQGYGYINVVKPMQDLRPGTLFFDHLERIAAVGKERMNQELIDLVRRTRPEITIVLLYTDQFHPETIRKLSEWTTTVAYFYDDDWRRDYADFWAGHFDFVTTANRTGLERFARAGFRNAILCPFAFNDILYQRMNVPLEYDATFVGGYHPYREWLMGRIRRAGLAVEVFGPGWPSGKIPLEEMVRVFNASRVNVNISNSAQWELRYVTSSVKALKWTLRGQKRQEQIKGRHFEIAGAGGFQMSYEVTGLDDFFVPGREIVTYRSSGDLVDKVRYYIAHDEERRRIAEQGWQRAHREHTAQQRMAALLDEVRARTS